MKRMFIACIFLFSLAFSLAAFSAAGGKEATTMAKAKKVRVIDGDTVWKQQCARCHFAPGAIPKKKMATVSRHMRDVAQLTDEEYQALLKFVTR